MTSGYTGAMGTYQRWLLTLVETRRTATTFTAWLAMSVTVILLLLVAAFVSPMREWFRLDFWSAIACFLPMMLLGLIAGWLESSGRLSLQAFGFWILVGAALFQFFWAGLVVLSQPPGAFVMASLFLVTVTFHGYLHRVTTSYPFGLICTVLAVGGAWALNPHAPTIPLLLFIGPTGILLSLLMGGAGLRMHHNAVRSDMMKQALYYRALNEKSREADAMSQRVFDLLKYNHDAGNTLSAIFVHAQLLEERVASEVSLPSGAGNVTERISALLAQLDRLKALIMSAHRVADSLPVVEPVRPRKVIEDVSYDCKMLFPQVAIRLPVLNGSSDATVKMHEGEAGLRRVVENVLRNACEGNGTTTASNVTVEITAEEKVVTLCFADDGPGFSDQQLGSPPAVLATTKPEGHGLGLYNVNELVRASGGSLSRRNSSSGGAVVDIVLQRDGEALA